MRKHTESLIATLFCLAISSVSSAQLLVMYESKADVFIKNIMIRHVGIEECRTEFDPRTVLKGINVRDDEFEYWREKNPMTPGGAENLMRWTFSGLTILATTYFDMYGPSTWLLRIEISDPAIQLDGDLRIGDSLDKYTEALELSDDMERTGRLASGRGDVTLHIDAMGMVSSLTIKCVAD